MSTATHVDFLGNKQFFACQKEAYIWLLERFIGHYPKPFVELDSDTLFLATGPRTRFFARSLLGLFTPKLEHLAVDANKSKRLSNGWYAKLVLSEQQKVEVLKKFGALAKLEFGKQWDWNDKGKNNPQLSSEELLQELQDYPT